MKYYQEFKKSLKEINQKPSGFWVLNFGHDLFARKLKYNIKVKPETLDYADLSHDFLSVGVRTRDLFNPYKVFWVKNIPLKKLTSLLTQIKSIETPHLILLEPSPETKWDHVQKLDSNDVTFITMPILDPRKQSQEYSSFFEDLLNEYSLNLTQEVKQVLYFQDLNTLENNLKTLALIFYQNQDVLELKEVEPHLNFTVDTYIYELENLYLSQNSPKIADFLKALLDQGESAQRVLGLLAQQIRKTLKIVVELEKGINSFEISKITGLPTFVIEKYKGFQFKKSSAVLALALKECLNTEILLKSYFKRPKNERLFFYAIID